MKVTYKDKVIELEENSKPVFLKRIACDLLDIGLLFILFFVLSLALMKTGLAGTYNMHYDAYRRIEDTYKLSTGVGVKDWDTQDKQGYIVYFDEQEGKSYVVVIDKEATDFQKDEYRKLLSEDQVYKDEKFGASLHLYLISVLNCFICESVLFLIVPLCNKKRATVGRLLFNISLYSLRRQKLAQWYNVVGRFAYVFLIESCALYLWLDIYTFILVPLLSLMVIMLNKNNRSLRDYISDTMLIESLSYSPITGQPTQQQKHDFIN